MASAYGVWELHGVINMFNEHLAACVEVAGVRMRTSLLRIL